MMKIGSYPDQFFNAAQMHRLGELMTAWRQARDLGSVLPPEAQAELESLIEAELIASGERAAHWADEGFDANSVRHRYR